jgi:hypothetical protein
VPRQPASDALLPRVVREVHPVGQHLEGAVDAQQPGRLVGEPRADTVQVEPGVAVGVPRVPRRRADDERRVAHDQVERLAVDRRQEVALPEVEGHVGQLRGHRSQSQGPRGDVCRDDLAAVPRRVQRLHAAAGADVEGPRHVAAHGHLGERRRRAADPEHVLRVEGSVPAVQPGPQVGHHPPGRAVRFRVRPDVEDGTQLARGPLHQAGGEQEVGRQGGRLPDVERVLQQEEPHQGVERFAAGRTPSRGNRLVPLQRCGGLRPEPVGDPLDGVARREERLPQLRPGRRRLRPSPRRRRCSCASRRRQHRR